MGRNLDTLCAAILFAEIFGDGSLVLYIVKLIILRPSRPKSYRGAFIIDPALHISIARRRERRGGGVIIMMKGRRAKLIDESEHVLKASSASMKILLKIKSA